MITRHLAFKLICVIGFLALNISLTQAENDTSEAFIYGGLAWSADGQTIAVGTNQGVWIHDSQTLSPIRLLPSRVVVTALAMSHQGDQLAVGFADGSIEVWNLNTFQSTVADVGHSLNIRDLQWNVDDSWLASSSDDKTVGRWNLETGSGSRDILLPTRNTAGSYPRIGWSLGDEFESLIVTFGGYLSIYAMTSNGPILSFERYNYQHSIQAMSVSADNLLIAGGLSGRSKDIMLWDMGANVVEQISLSDQTGDTSWESLGVSAIVWSPSSRRIAVQTRLADPSVADFVQIWDFQTHDLVHQFGPPIVRIDTEYANAIMWSPSGDRIASTSDDGHVYVWDAETFELLSEYSEYMSLAG